MGRDISLKLDNDWIITRQNLLEDNIEILNFNCIKQKGNYAEIDIYAGDLIEDTTAEDQAFANYVEMVGVENEDEELPIYEIQFNNKKAFCFEAYTEEEQAIKVICQETKGSTLLVISILAQNQEEISNIIQLLEKGLRIRI